MRPSATMPSARRGFSPCGGAATDKIDISASLDSASGHAQPPEVWRMLNDAPRERGPGVKAGPS